MIKKTDDYTIFKKHSGNRGIIPYNVKKLVSSISMKNLLHLKPIVVNKDMEVLDGQHRLEAAKDLGIPVYYEIHSDYEPQDIALMNVQDQWKKEDFLRFYVSQGLSNYIELEKVMKKYNITFSLALQIFGDKEDYDSKHKTDFRKGTFKFPTGDDLQESLDILDKITKTVDYIYPKMRGNTTYIKTARFASGLRAFLAIKAVDFDIFLRKLEIRLDLIRPCANTVSFINMFKSIYNWRNKSPILTEEDLLIEDN